jgi:hypothetical protein
MPYRPSQNPTVDMFVSKAAKQFDNRTFNILRKMAGRELLSLHAVSATLAAVVRWSMLGDGSVCIAGSNPKK